MYTLLFCQVEIINILLHTRNSTVLSDCVDRATAALARTMEELSAISRQHEWICEVYSFVLEWRRGGGRVGQPSAELLEVSKLYVPLKIMTSLRKKSTSAHTELIQRHIYLSQWKSLAPSISRRDATINLRTYPIHM